MTRHKWFFDILRHTIEQNNLSINEFSKLTSISYVSLHRMLSGDQNINEKDYLKMVAIDEFDDATKLMLEKAFYNRNINKDDRSKMDAIFNLFSSLYQTIHDEEYIYINPIVTHEINNRSIEGLSRIKQYISHAITSMANHENKIRMRFFIGTNGELINEVYFALLTLSRVVDLTRLDVEFMLLFDSTNKMESKLHSINSLAGCIKLINLCSFVRIKYISKQGASQYGEMSVFPYYIVIGDQVILLSLDNSQAIILSDVQDCARSYLNAYEQLGPKTDLTRDYDALELNSYIADLTMKNNYFDSVNYTLRYSFSTMNINNKMFADRLKKTFTSLAIKNFSPYDLSMIKIYGARLKKEKLKVKSGMVRQYALKKGIVEFLKEGYLSDYLEIGGEFSDYERVQICHQALLNINDGYQLRLIDDEVLDDNPFLKLIQNYEFYFDCDELMIARYLEMHEANIPPKSTMRMSGRSIRYAVVVDVPEVTDAFRLFYSKYLKAISWKKRHLSNT